MTEKVFIINTSKRSILGHLVTSKSEFRHSHALAHNLSILTTAQGSFLTGTFSPSWDMGLLEQE